jgi:hypothetical protein
MGGIGITTIAIGAIVTFLAASVALSSGTGNPATCTTPETAVENSASEPIAGYAGDQLANATTIIDTANSHDFNTQAAVIAVMVAIAETNLTNLDHATEGAPITAVGLFQQPPATGTLAERLDPVTAAAGFFTALGAVPGWAQLAPAAAASAATGTRTADFYAPALAPASEILNSLAAPAAPGSCEVGSDATALAQELVTAANAGLLTGSIPDHIKEIRWIAQGQAVNGCGIDTRILQILVLALHHFHTVQVSDINRNCTHQIAGLGVLSTHYRDGGGAAVDILRLDGLHLTGADGQSLRLISLLDPVIPHGAGLGQVDCRQRDHTTVITENFTQFKDRCNHLHIDVGSTNLPLTVGVAP